MAHKYGKRGQAAKQQKKVILTFTLWLAWRKPVVSDRGCMLIKRINCCCSTVNTPHNRPAYSVVGC